ncbi:MAG: DUF3134 domain-containing protein [Sphaerospermopsis sp.]|jgi:hypothetical protein|uniref:DUF3134 domain-containing protein n=3 Tax=Sphaerospermopsis TaxID=752201 RepID=A0A479ZRI3_9CYAN|nr:MULTISPECIES: DUF3134 domain-containing protein [Sphaerospermopsis]MEB3149861.1 DUF3134 domain-containing protein [Sphaerospermopsis sp.]BAZ79877.1 hypothetical protein NIES73_11230 [Sphaerospermopsis kisseleviana NIES-73]MBC5797745.1 DUF3134 domain-containing protein [Sphaerospermopsis sp. LEGE 00249]MBD2134569.1 DUF3134 domain-containing protein [Sphaerospermopsis sp. FACHB-1094]MBD2143982.1 DUF3134 domain-containing protein [Sphaerospermopsis sp. FACHB-1194]
MLNGPLHEQPRNQRATVIRTSNEFILLEWLKSTGRLIAREHIESDLTSDVEEEISEIIDLDDLAYDNDDDTGLDLED